jgi:hypothetical protein
MREESVKKMISLGALALIGASAFAMAALAQVPAAVPAPAAAPAAAAPEDKKVETFATLPSNEASENACQAADGSIYISLINARQIMKVTPDGKVSEFASAPMMAHILGLGCGNNEIAAIAYGKTFRGTPAVAATATTPAVPAGPLHFDDTDTHVYVYDMTGKMQADIAAQKGIGFNGLTPSTTAGVYYASNSNGGDIYTVDTKAKTIALWWKDDSYGPATGAPIGLNGVKLKNGWVYFSSGTQGTAPKRGLYRIQVAADGKPMGNPVKIEDSVAVDDFDVAADGSVYFPGGTTLYKAALDGTLTKVADPIQGGPTAVVSRDGKYVYWPTRGGTANQRLVRVAIQ